MKMKKTDSTNNVGCAVAHFWKTREKQAKKQKESGRRDQGARGSVTGGAQMDGFIDLMVDLICESGINPDNIFRKNVSSCPASSGQRRNGIYWLCGTDN